MKKVYKRNLKPIFRKYPPLAVLYAWVCFLVIVPVCIPGIIITEGWEEVKHTYSDVIPIMFWQVED